MTIVEFLHPIIRGPVRDLCLAILYFEQRYGGKDALTVQELRAALRRAHIPRINNINLAGILGKMAPFVYVVDKKGHAFLWSITSTGQRHIRSLLGLPEADAEIEHDVSSLEKLLTSISDKDMTDYINESIKCLSIGALRAATVFLWAGAVRKIQEEVIAYRAQDVNTAIIKYDPKARKIKRIDDLSYIKESTLLFTAQELGLFDKNQRGVLEDALELRNKCGHPGKYKPGPKKVSSFIEDVVGIVFT